MENTTAIRVGNFEARNKKGELLTSGDTIQAVENKACFAEGYVYDKKKDRFFVAGRYPINRHNWVEGRFLPEYMRNCDTTTQQYQSTLGFLAKKFGTNKVRRGSSAYCQYEVKFDDLTLTVDEEGRVEKVEFVKVANIDLDAFRKAVEQVGREV